MPPNRLRNVIIGLALAILGPALGAGIYILMLFHAAQPGQPLSFQQAMADMARLPSQLLTALIPLIAGSICGSVGFFLVIVNLVIHFFGRPGTYTSAASLFNKPPPPSPDPPAHQAPQAPDDSRYMPKYY